MNNSHVDPNISLGLNFLEGIRVSNVEIGHKPFGLDIGHRNVQDMMKCAFKAVDTLRDTGAKNIYYHLPMLYYAHLMDQDALPSYWDGVRMFHLLPRYMNHYAEGKIWPFPKVLVKEKPRNALYAKYGEVLAEQFGKPLSYVPDIDAYWLGDSINVFDVLGEQIYGFMTGAELGEEGFRFPKSADHFDRWLYNELTINRNYICPGLLYLIHFFPQRVSMHAFDTIIGNADKLARMVGDDKEMVVNNPFALLKYGPPALKMWISENK